MGVARAAGLARSWIGHAAASPESAPNKLTLAVWKPMRGWVLNQRMDLAEVASRGSTPNRAGRDESNTNGSTLRLTITCGRWQWHRFGR